MTTVEKFTSLHHQAQPLILPNAWDAASAKIIEDLGAPAIATTSAGVAWAFGFPDGRQLPSQLQVQVAHSINRVIKVPLTVDFENGYSDDPAVVAENIKPLLDAGIAGINIEDGPDAPELLAAKVEAIKRAVAAHGSKLFINVRTDVYLASLVPAEKMVEEVLKRAKLFTAAGGDGLFVPFIIDPVEIEQIAKSVSLPLNVLAMAGLAKADKLAELGVKRLSAGASVARMAWHTVAKAAQGFLETGDSAIFQQDAMTSGKLNQLFVSL